MRPVLLDMNGFASFREPVTVDFSDAEFFALVGPTGSGKSTVIDAMTFALFGSVPRWNDKRMISLALAPTANRGTVRLVFDIGQVRYVVARELRRTTQGVGVKSARLERLDDPNATGAMEDSTEVLAADSGVTGEVERLLGLTFENFCQCVVLPQGEFAEFLRAKSSDRQKILLKLLGAERYEAIGKQANTRSAAAGERSAFLTNQLLAFADATEDAVRAAAEREAALDALAGHVTAALPELTNAATAVTEAKSACERLAREQEALTALEVPDGIAELDEALTARKYGVAVAAVQEAAAQAADTAARESLASAPARGPLEQARHDHAEQARIKAGLPAARTAAEEAALASENAAVASVAARSALENSRARCDATGKAAAAADAERDHIEGALRLLRGATMPAGIREVQERTHNARTLFAAAKEVATAAEDADADARSAVDAAPEKAPLESTLRDLETLAEVEGSEPELAAAHERSKLQHRDAEAAFSTAADMVASARAARESAAVAHRAAALRAGLTTGENCPVCDQAVAELPAPLHAPELADAEHTIAVADAALENARRAEIIASRAEAKAAADHDGVLARISMLKAALSGRSSDPTAVRAELARLDALAEVVRTRAAALREARGALAGAQEAVATAEGNLSELRKSLRAARDPLVALQAPDVDESDLLGAWTQLTEWAAQEATLWELKLEASQSECHAATAALGEARVDFAALDTDVTARQAVETETHAARQLAETQLGRFEQRLIELTATLADAPPDAEAERQLTALAGLERAVRDADAALLTARRAREEAETAARLLKDDVKDAWQVLRASRDRLVPLGAPDVEGAGILSAWETLCAWAIAAFAERSAAMPAALQAVEIATQHRDAAERKLAEALVAHDVSLPAGPLYNTAPVALEGARERARNVHARLVERRAEAAQLHTRQALADTEQKVAKLLADLLRSNQFPRWLVESALDALVLDASASLAELSGGQFELTHKAGEFYVVDHADADSHRSVRTLSGGETFQASLALALALSSQMSSLAAAGAARLDSIFLDEGFGTLDEATLEVVAVTLENLANGDRMVGVVTHVAALAERVPVRFVVRRDHRTSTVVRESA